MGLKLSRPTDNVASRKNRIHNNRKIKSKSSQEVGELNLEQEQVARSYSLQIAEGEEALSTDLRQIIIKIQLAKMENDNNGTEELEEQQQQQQQQLAIAEGAVTSDTLNANEQIVNVRVEGGGGAAAGKGVKTEAVSGAIRTAGSSTEAPKTNERQLVAVVNNNNLLGSVASASAAVKTLQLHDVVAVADVDVDVDVDFDEADESEIATTSLLRRRRSSSIEGVDYCEVLEPTTTVNEMLSSGAQRTQGNSCCRSRSSKTMSLGAAATPATTAAATTAATSKRRCCKCKYRDAINGLRGMLQSSSPKDKKEATTRDTAAAAATSRSKTRNNVADRRSTPPTTTTTTTAARLQTQRQRNSVAIAEPSQLAIWAAPAANGHGDVIIRISSQPQPQFVVEQAAATVAGCSCVTNNNNTTPVVTMVPNIRLVASTESANVLPPSPPIEQPRPLPANAYGVGVTVHSQIDFMHCLVPDLEKIINSNFYFGKMDRYEAERLLEGKPEGTFLLRDSAQEEFLFSVTFRKYGRSLHARIEQSGHKFSFDCHDPCVFSALTVTGLLEHYKDPSCVMFFEPCLTMPLHRRQTFSLQQLARATIVSNTTYDGINQLELPGPLKSYLKEYHYKQKLRVKPCDAHTPAPYYANI